MNTIIQKWGNSQGIRIPKGILAELGILENDKIEISTKGDSIILKKAQVRKHKTVKERLETFYGKSINQIGSLELDSEIETGNPVGEEIW